MHHWLQSVWYENAPSGFWLRPLAWIFGGLVALRRALYAAGVLRTQSAGRPVVVIGNLTVGGTGKTPLTLWLAARLRERGLKVGIVLRGYRSGEGRARRVTADSRSEEAGDEALLLARRSGAEVAIGTDRVAASRLLVARGVDILLSDDGLQHLRLRRDLDIVVVDGARRFGNGRLLPAGPLRESADRLSRAAAVVVNGGPAARGEIAMALQPGEAVPVAGGIPRALTDFKTGKIHAVAAIGHPERFFRMLQSSGLEIIRHPFPDHHALQRTDIEFGDDRPVLMTEKDAVKCEGFAGPRHWFVPVDAVLDRVEGDKLVELVLALLPSRRR